MIDSTDVVSDAQLEAAYAARGVSIQDSEGRTQAWMMAQHRRGLRMVADVVAGQVSKPKPVAVIDSNAAHANKDVVANLERAGYVVIVARPEQVRIVHEPATSS